MARRLILTTLAAALMPLAGALLPLEAAAQTYEPGPAYYVPAGTEAGVTALLYPCPRPVPPWVGGTVITYEPLAPHEFLYQHHEKYVRHNGCAGTTRTSVTWNHHHRILPITPTLLKSVPALHGPTTPVINKHY